MQLNSAIETALAQVAWRYNADAAALRRAIEHESAAELAEVLQLAPPVAEERMARICRTLTVQSDWGAGCRLLTDDVQAELLTALAEL